MDTSTTERDPDLAAAPADTAAAAAAAPLGLYAGIHKALRLFMSRTLCQVGSVDPGDTQEVAAALDMLERLLGLCELHLKDENEFVHPALERARPGSAARIAAEHVHHAEAIADLRDLAGLVADSRDGARAPACTRLYRALALYVANNFQHMHVEETAHNAVLWAHYSDDELLAVLLGGMMPVGNRDALFHLYAGVGINVKLSCAEAVDCDAVNSTMWTLPIGLSFAKAVGSGRFIGIDARYNLGLSDSFEALFPQTTQRSWRFGAFFGLPVGN